MVSREAPRRVMAGSSRGFLAASIATAFKSRSTDSEAAALHETAMVTQTKLAVRLGVDERRRLVTLADAITRASKSVPHEDRVAVVASIVRELLVDSPESCMDLDRAVRDACERRYMTTEDHVECARRIVDKVMR